MGVSGDDTVSGHRIVRLACGHERWAPWDWDGHSRLGCTTCGLAEQPVIAASPSLGDQDTPRNREHADRVDRAAFPDLPESKRYIPRSLDGETT